MREILNCFGFKFTVNFRGNQGVWQLTAQITQNPNLALSRSLRSLLNLAWQKVEPLIWPLFL